MDVDPHNFGLLTRKSQSRIVKYRNCLPECLFLGLDSRLRLFLNGLFPEGELLPGLRILTPYQDGPHHGPVEIEFLETTPVDRMLTVSESRQVGAFIALSSYLGLSDCHRSNLAVGFSQEKFIFTSLDWETILSPVRNAYDLAFFRAKRNCSCAGNFCLSYGLYEIAPFALTAEVLSGFTSMTVALRKSHAELMRILQSELLDRKWIRRAVIRDTVDYMSAMNVGNKDFFPEENEQLLRGDVPYFFQIGGTQEIYYWATPDEYKRADTASWNLPSDINHRIGSTEEFSFDVVRNIARSLDLGEKNQPSQNSEFHVHTRGDIILIDSPRGKTFANRIY